MNKKTISKKKRDRQAELEKEHLLNPEKVEKNRKNKRIRLLTAVLCGLLAVVFVILLSFEAVKAVGKSNLKSMAAESVPELVQAQEEQTLSEQEKQEWKEGQVKYEGKIYAYNKDILTFLFMGIDKKHEVTEVAEGTNGGQADALFLLVLNPHDKSIRVIGINRNTMTDIDLYNDEGAYMTTVTAQIAVQHGFGNGMEESCEYQQGAVKKLFYNLPIHGYCAINMDAVISLTDLVGGIELTALEDVKSKLEGEDRSKNVVSKDENAVLDGKKAYSYVSYRDTKIAGSADMRLKRQQQFLKKFIDRAKEQTASDITLPVKLYQAVAKQMVTNVTVDEVAYLASTVSGYRFDKEHLYSLQGETIQGEQFEEFYVDEEALYEMILEIFYEPVGE